MEAKKGFTGTKLYDKSFEVFIDDPYKKLTQWKGYIFMLVL